MPFLVYLALLLACAAALQFEPPSGLTGEQVASSVPDGLPEKRYLGPDNPGCRKLKRADWDETIVGGSVVNDSTRFPFIAWIGDKDGTGLRQFCGGSLISDRVVLTAAHCLYQEDSKNAGIYVRLRLTDYAQEPGLAYRVVNWARHEQVNLRSLRNDIGLLLLNESVPKDLVQPVPLSNGTQGFERSGEKVIAGWGSTDERCLNHDAQLRETSVPMGSSGPSCSTPGSKVLTEGEQFDPNTQLCAGAYSSQKMEYPGCGDSGGPLLHSGPDGFVQVGFVDWTYGFPYPDVFTRVSSYLEWIWATSAQLEAQGKRRNVH